jgi:hypothetical protein
LKPDAVIYGDIKWMGVCESGVVRSGLKPR